MDFFRNRRSGILRSAKADEVGAYLITERTNVRYLCGSPAVTALLITAKSTAVVCDERTAAHSSPASSPELTPFLVRTGGRFEQTIAEAIQKFGCKAVAIEAGHLPVGAFRALEAACPKVAFKPVADRVEDLRLCKDASEVESIRNAVRISERAYTMFRVIIRETETEIDLCHLMDRFVRQAGAHASSIPALVSLGENGADPLHVPTTKVLGEVSKGLVTWGADVGYCSSLARAFRSPFDPPLVRKTKFERTGHQFDKVTKAVKDAAQAAVAEIRPGAEIAAVVAAARKVLNEAGFEKYLEPELGHGLGLLPREAPYLIPNSKGTLASGMVLTVAPDVRIPEWGGVKHSLCVLVGREGASELTHGIANFDG
jgi:Xaa-Pro aminopeptidase